MHLKILQKAILVNRISECIFVWSRERDAGSVFEKLFGTTGMTKQVPFFSIHYTGMMKTVKCAVIAFYCVVCSISFVWAEEAARWEEAEENVIDKSYPDSFIDSLKGVYGVGNQRGIRKAVSTDVFDYKETMVLKARWGPFNAGFGIFSSHTDAAKTTLTIEGKAVTVGLVNALYKVGDLFEATVDRNGFYTLFSEEHIRERKYRDHRWALFDHHNRRIFSSEKPDSVFDSPQFVYDILTLFYFLRSQRLTPGDSLFLYTFLHKKRYDVLFTAVKKEVVKVDVGEFSCVVIETRVSDEGKKLPRKEKFEMWLSDDKFQILVQVRMKIKFGSLIGELIHYTHPLRTIHTDDK
jgi:hypothetical protein